jgi:hypothetical protein
MAESGRTCAELRNELSSELRDSWRETLAHDPFVLIAVGLEANHAGFQIKGLIGFVSKKSSIPYPRRLCDPRWAQVWGFARRSGYCVQASSESGALPAKQNKEKEQSQSCTTGPEGSALQHLIGYLFETCVGAGQIHFAESGTKERARH